MKIYTKTGDTGTTSLVGGKRVSKTHVRLEAYGTVDELSAYLGLLQTYLPKEEEKSLIQWVQNRLFDLGSRLATEDDSPYLDRIPEVGVDEVDRLEQAIDEMQQGLPPLQSFVLPGGCRGAALCHVCRTVCRRAERRVLAMADEGIAVDERLVAFLNRLSDFLFVLARKMNNLSGCEEIFWEKACN